MSNKSIIHRLYSQKKIMCPDWLPDNLCYLTVMGSRAYGVENKDSDWDYYGFCMIPRKNIFPHEYGLLLNLDNIPKFDQWQQSHFVDEDSGKDMEFTVYGIVRYAQLLAEGNPNIVESLFTPRESIIYSTVVGEKFRENRHLFLSKQSFIRTRQYSFAQMKKLKRKPEGNRLEDYEKYGYSTKFAGHAVRLMDNCDQIISSGTIDLRRNSEMVKSIRAGEWTLNQLEDYFAQKEIHLEKSYAESRLQEKPNMNKIRDLVLDCIKYSYQGVNFVKPNAERDALDQIESILNNLKRDSVKEV
jgi:hypothetical protein